MEIYTYRKGLKGFIDRALIKLRLKKPTYKLFNTWVADFSPIQNKEDGSMFRTITFSYNDFKSIDKDNI